MLCFSGSEKVFVKVTFSVLASPWLWLFICCKTSQKNFFEKKIYIYIFAFFTKYMLFAEKKSFYAKQKFYAEKKLLLTKTFFQKKNLFFTQKIYVLQIKRYI